MTEQLLHTAAELRAIWLERISRVCPTCSQEPGQPCVTVGGRVPGAPYSFRLGEWNVDVPMALVKAGRVHSIWEIPYVHAGRSGNVVLIWKGKTV